MLGYCTLGTNDLKASAEFYDPIAQILGHGRVMESDRTVMWGTQGQGAMFGIIKPYNEKQDRRQRHDVRPRCGHR